VEPSASYVPLLPDHARARFAPVPTSRSGAAGVDSLARFRYRLRLSHKPLRNPVRWLVVGHHKSRRAEMANWWDGGLNFASSWAASPTV
jgi:hypothetical protein